MKANRSCTWDLPDMYETPFKIIFWINKTSIYTTTWRTRCSQKHRLACLNTSARRYISWKHIWYICLTVVIFWICLRFRNVGKNMSERRVLNSKIHCLTLDLLCATVSRTIFFSVYFFLEISLFFRFFGL